MSTKPIAALTLLAFTLSCSSGPKTPPRATTTSPPPTPTAKPAPPAAPKATPVYEGSTQETAIQILESTEPAGVRAERQWLINHYPGYRKLKSGVVADGPRHFDVVTLQLPDGTERTLFFDITGFYGLR